LLIFSSYFFLRLVLSNAIGKQKTRLDYQAGFKNILCFMHNHFITLGCE